MKVKQLTKYITSYKDRTPVHVEVEVDNWYLCEFTCLRGNISNFNNKTAAEFYDDYDKVFTLKNILGATVIGIEALRENELSIEIDINEIYDFEESIRRNRYRGLREGDASLKTNYAVAVRDMHTAHIHLLTGTKSECESLIGSLETADDYMNDDYMDEYEKDEYIQTLYDEVLSQYNWINDINYREIDNRNNYYDPDSGKYYHILNKNWFDLYI